MRCGEKCFYVTADINGEVQTTPVNARTSPEARRAFRKAYGKSAPIISVRKKK